MSDGLKTRDFITLPDTLNKQVNILVPNQNIYDDGELNSHDLAAHLDNHSIVINEEANQNIQNNGLQQNIIPNAQIINLNPGILLPNAAAILPPDLAQNQQNHAGQIQENNLEFNFDSDNEENYDDFSVDFREVFFYF